LNRSVLQSNVVRKQSASRGTCVLLYGKLCNKGIGFAFAFRHSGPPFSAPYGLEAIRYRVYSRGLQPYKRQSARKIITN
jgi:hypothetical protein